MVKCVVCIYKSDLASTSNYSNICNCVYTVTLFKIFSVFSSWFNPRDYFKSIIYFCSDFKRQM